MQLKKVLVTGSSGTIGTRLCEKLIEQNHHVLGLDVRKNKWNDKINNITVLGDLRSEEILKGLTPDLDLVVHLSANARVYNLVEDPRLAKDNVDMLFNVLEFSRINNIPRFIFASSREVYGNLNNSSFTEEDIDVENCESPYTASKIAGEAFVHAYNKCYGIDYLIFRFSNVYGMYDDSDRIVPLYIKKTNNNENLIVYGGEKKLDFTYIDDAVDGIISGIKNFDQVKGETFNIASGKGTKIIDLAFLIQETMGKRTNIIIKENRIGEITNYVADVSKAREKLVYHSKVDIVEGVKRSIEWYNNH